MGLGCLLSPLVFSYLDVKFINVIFLSIHCLSMVVFGLVFLYPLLSVLQLPCLVLSALSYGLGLRPVPFVLMSSIFPLRMKSLGVAASQSCRALSLLVLMKVTGFMYKCIIFYDIWKVMCQLSSNPLEYHKS